MKQMAIFVVFVALAQFTSLTKAHQAPTSIAHVDYLGNEALLFTGGDTKVLFDPFFHNDYGNYQLVPDEIREAIFAASPPYDNVSAIVISHAHGDHFAADDVANYLSQHQKVKLVAPGQAIDKVLEENPELESQLIAIRLNFGDAPVVNTVDGVTVESVRIPHAGWPQRKEVANLVHRVSLDNGKTIMHMGDADPDDAHFAPFSEYWERRETDTAFPPYWFFISRQGPMILKSRINAREAIGVHVPVEVPAQLKDVGAKFFSTPGERHFLQ